MFSKNGLPINFSVRNGVKENGKQQIARISELRIFTESVIKECSCTIINSMNAFTTKGNSAKWKIVSK